MKVSSAFDSLNTQSGAGVSSGYRVSGDNIEIAALGRLAARISSGIPLGQVLNETAQFSARMAQCDSCLVYVAEDEDLVVRASIDPFPSSINRLKTQSVDKLWESKNNSTQQSLILAQRAHEDPRFHLFSGASNGPCEGFLSVRLVSGGRLVGLMNLYRREELRLEAAEIALISTIASLAASEIERARLEREHAAISEQLESRKIVERAKGILQRELKLSEEEAYLTLQRESRTRRKPMKEVASAVVLTDDLKRGR